jgi:hypothetical protein
MLPSLILLEAMASGSIRESGPDVGLNVIGFWEEGE